MTTPPPPPRERPWLARAQRFAITCLMAGICAPTTGCVGFLLGGDDDGKQGSKEDELPPEDPHAVVAAELSPLRRLTHEEYKLTIFDLFGVESAVAKTLPSEEGVDAFSNDVGGQLVVPFLVQTYGAVSREMAESATADLPAFLGCTPSGDEEGACIEGFIRRFGKRVYRRPLTNADVTKLLAAYDEARGSSDAKHSTELLLSRMLQSPYFLFRAELGVSGSEDAKLVPLTDYELATRLSYLFTGSMPDEVLFAAADAGMLQAPEELEAQARRLLGTDRAKEIAWRFMREWFDVDRADSIFPDKAVFVGFKAEDTDALVEDMREFFDYVLWSSDARLETLLTSNVAFGNKAVGDFYPLFDMTQKTQQIALDPLQRAGVLTHPAWLAIYAGGTQTDPVRRGKFVREEVLCQQLPDPPPDVAATPPELGAGMTTRQRYEQHSTNPSCAGCHRLMDSIGFAFEHYDPVGRWRDLDNGLPVDSTGSIVNGDAVEPIDGAPALASWLAASPEVASCATKQWFRFAFGRHERDADDATLADMNASFDAANHDLTELMVAVTKTEAFRNKQVSE